MKSWPLLVGGFVIAGCTSPATQALVVLDSDAPPSRALRVNVTARFGADGSRASIVRAFDFAAMRDPSALPASFAVVPSKGERNERVSLRFDVAVAAGASAPEVRYAVERTFQFVPNTRQRLGVYLPLRCGDPATGCPPSVATCTVAALCTSRGQTCGDDATCVDPFVVPEIVTGGFSPGAELDAARPDVQRDASIDTTINDVPDDTGTPDVRDATTDTPTDTFACPPMMTACSGACIDLQNNPRHCGACGARCNGTCTAGRCDTTSMLSVGRNVVCAGFGSPATVRCWGDNNNGERGTGDNAPSSIPAAAVRLPGSATAIATGGSSSCALLATSGEVHCWGFNGSGQLGDASTTARSTPVRAGMLTAQRGVSVGSSFACAWDTSSAQCWGRGTSGQLGDGMIVDRTSPAPVTGLSAVRQVSAGGVHACAVNTSGTVFCWGDNTAGEVGQPMTTTRYTMPTPLPGLNASSIAVGGTSSATAFSAALTAMGEVWTWGANNSGQLGHSSGTPSVPTPTRVMGLPTIRQISAGANHLCALATTGAVFCWGSNANGALGGGIAATSSATPVAVTGISDGVELAAGQLVTCVRRMSGEISCWGNNTAGQLGQGFSARTADLPTVPTITNARSVHAGEDFTCAITDTGDVRCWGKNDLGQLGDGTRTPSPSPTAAVLSNAQTMDVMGQSACAIQMSRGVFCWGNNATGQLANGREGDSSPTPTQVPGLPSMPPISGIAMERHVIAWNGLATFAWGYCIESQCTGSPPTGRRFAPEPFVATHTVTSASAGATHSCSIDAAGQVYCVGGNYSGQLGEPAFSGGWPTQRTVAGLADVVEVESGSGFNCARRRNNTVHCWGNNGAGQLGDGTTTNRHTFSMVAGTEETAQLSVGVTHACARRSDGTIRCWGGNNGSMLGATPATAFTPTAALPLPPSRWVSAGTTHTCAVAMDGTIRCWGDNSQGQLGVSFTSGVPVTVRL